MPDFKVATIELAASYNQIGSSMTMRRTPLYIADQLLQNISEPVDFLAAFAEVQGKTYTAVDAKAAGIDAHAFFLEILNRPQTPATGITYGIDPEAFYQPGSGGYHGIGLFLNKSVNGGTPEPLPFSFLLDGNRVDGFVAISMYVVDAALLAQEMASQTLGQKSAPRSAVATPRTPSPAPVTHHQETVPRKTQR